jgi:ArsR family transcriptional regulator
MIKLDEAPERVRGCCVQLAAALPDRTAQNLVVVYKALADETRVQMLHMLKAAREPICVCDFTAAFDLGQPTVSHHLAKLKAAGVITSFKRGVWAFYQLRDDMPDAVGAALKAIP